MIYFDLDGTVRNLHATLNLESHSWNDFKEHHREYMISHPVECLENAPVYEPVKNFINSITDEPRFLTVNHGPFRSNLRFVEKHFPKGKIRVLHSFEDKMKLLMHNDFLVDDYPYFFEFLGEAKMNKIILIDRPWNREHQHHYKNVLKLEG